MSARPRMAVDWVTITLAPVALCEECGWASSRYGSAAIEARGHARRLPGHTMVVIREKRTEYVARKASA